MNIMKSLILTIALCVSFFLVSQSQAQTTLGTPQEESNFGRKVMEETSIGSSILNGKSSSAGASANTDTNAQLSVFNDENPKPKKYRYKRSGIFGPAPKPKRVFNNID